MGNRRLTSVRNGGWKDVQGNIPWPIPMIRARLSEKTGRDAVADARRACRCRYRADMGDLGVIYWAVGGWQVGHPSSCGGSE